MYLLIALVISATYIFITYVVVTFVILFFEQNRMTRIIKYVAIFLICLAPFSEVILSNLSLQYLCAKYAGEKYFARPSSDSGLYFNAHVSGYSPVTYAGCASTCVSLLARGEYSFIEYNVDYARDEYLPGGMGYFRYSLKEKGHDDCKLFETAMASGTFRSGELISDPNKCLAVEKIDELTARLFLTDRKIDKEFLMQGYRLFVYEIIEAPSKLIASYSTIAMGNDGWLLPFLHNKSCGKYVNPTLELKPNTREDQASK